MSDFDWRDRLRRVGPHGWSIAAIMLVAAVLRFWGLGSESLWVDELTTLAQTQWGPMRIITESVIRGTPPLYYLLLSVVYGVLPAGEWGLRLLSAVADLISVYLVYAVGSRLVDRKAALGAAALLAISVRVLWFAQEARAYSLGMMLSLLAALTLFRFIERPTWPRGALHTFIAIALLYTHVFSAFVLFGIELAVLVSPRIRRRLGAKWWAAAGVTALAYVPWMMALVTQIATRAQLVDSGDWSIAAPKGTFGPMISAIGDLAPGVSVAIPYWGPVGWPTYLFIALVVLGLVAPTWRGRSRPTDEPGSTQPWEFTPSERQTMLAAWAGMVIAGGVLISKAAMPIFGWRMATQAAPALFICAANGVRQLWRPLAIGVAILLLVMGLMGLVPYYDDTLGRGIVEKEDWRSAVQFVSEQGRSADAVLVGASWHTRQMTLYGDLLGRPLPQLTGIERGLESDELTAAVRAATDSADRVIEVSGHVKYRDDGRSPVQAVLEADGWRRVLKDDARYIRLRVYERTASTP